jgi:hypothetical protein
LIKQWVDSLPATSMNFYDYKTEFFNSDKKKSLETLFETADCSNGALTFWHLHYQKYDKTEGDRLHYTSNLLNGFIQRIDEKVRNHSLGVFGIYGDEPDLE